MKHSIIILFIAMCFAGCSPEKAHDGDTPSEPRTAVTLTHAIYGHLDQTISFQATTAYRSRSVVSTPVAGFISNMFVTEGDRVRAGQLLYNIESKERHAMGSSYEGGIIPIRAAHDGIVLSTLQQSGDYTAEGATLCVIADSKSLVFEINVPYEQRKDVKSGYRCTIELPDGSQIEATVQQPLASMSTSSQTEQVTATAKTSFLPEGLRVRALFSTSNQTEGKALLLPKSAVMSDETLTRQWVMKLADDSTATKVSVRVARSNATQIEIVSDSLSPKDDIILTGGYGLEQGEKVTVVKKEANI